MFTTLLSDLWTEMPTADMECRFFSSDRCLIEKNWCDFVLLDLEVQGNVFNEVCCWTYYILNL